MFDMTLYNIVVFVLILLLFKLISINEKRFRIKSHGMKVIFVEKISLVVFKYTLYSLIAIGAVEFDIRALEYNIFSVVFLSLFIIGVLLRIYAIKSLGKFWTFNIVSFKNHMIINKGVYKYIRHPAYVGNIYIVSIFGLLNLKITVLISFVFITVFGVWRALLESKLLKKHIIKNELCLTHNKRSYAMRGVI